MVVVIGLALLWAIGVFGGSRSDASVISAPDATATPTQQALPLATAVVKATATAQVAASVEPSASVGSTPAPADRSTAQPSTTAKSWAGLHPTGPVQVARVVSITDGDTIRVQFGGAEYRVRYIGMDTPETHFGTEWMGPEAAHANAALVAGRQVVLEKDVSETDQFGRLLRYVWLHEDGRWTLANLELLREGFAQVATYPPDVKYIDPYFLDAQREARQAGIGLWAGQPATTDTPSPTTPLGFTGGRCEPSYPDICIPIGVPDLDCGEIDARRFRVLWDVPDPDPHRFDADHDGIGCQS